MKLIEIFFSSKPDVKLYDIISETEKAYVFKEKARNSKIMKRSLSTFENITNSYGFYRFVGDESDIESCILAIIDYKIRMNERIIESANKEIAELKEMKKKYGGVKDE